MHILRSIFKQVLAALIFFTRLPLGRWVMVEERFFQHLVPLWPLIGWLTGGVMAGVYALAHHVGLGVDISVVLALLARLLLTGALHEDGLADFCDGFGGGRTRKRTLEIMKDSHIGSYGVLGLIMYYVLMCLLMASLMNRGMSPLIFVVVDAACKFLSSTIIWFLPYARREEDAKNGMVYARTSLGEKVLSLCFGILPIVVVCLIPYPALHLSLLSLLLSLSVAALCCTGLFFLMRRRLGGYTGDCCGATFLLSELTCYLMLNCLFEL